MIFSFRMRKIASSLPIPSSISLSTDALNSFNWLAMAAFMAIMAAAQLAEDPAARNSKRFPVNAKGEVRLRSVVSSRISGIRPIPNFKVVFSSGVIFELVTWRTISSSVADSCEPRKMDKIAGGASLAPKRWLFPALIIEARNRSWFLWTIINTFTRKVRNSMFPFGFLPGAKRLMPVSVQSDQLLCLPEPLTPL